MNDREKNRKKGLGALHKLPYELVYKIFSELSYAELANMQLVSSMMKEFVREGVSIHEWLKLLSEAPATMSANQYQKLVDYIKSQDFFKNLSKKLIESINDDAFVLLLLVNGIGNDTNNLSSSITLDRLGDLIKRTGFTAYTPAIQLSLKLLLALKISKLITLPEITPNQAGLSHLHELYNNLSQQIEKTATQLSELKERQSQIEQKDSQNTLDSQLNALNDLKKTIEADISKIASVIKSEKKITPGQAEKLQKNVFTVLQQHQNKYNEVMKNIRSSLLAILLVNNPDSNRLCLRNENLDFFTFPNNSNLSHSDLSHAHAHYLKLIAGDLSGANLQKSKLSHAVLDNTDFTNADLSGANLFSASMISVILKGANLDGANLEYCNLSNADLTDANLCNTKIRVLAINGANLTRTHFISGPTSVEDLQNQFESLQFLDIDANKTYIHTIRQAIAFDITRKIEALPTNEYSTQDKLDMLKIAITDPMFAPRESKAMFSMVNSPGKLFGLSKPLLPTSSQTILVKLMEKLEETQKLEKKGQKI